MKKSYETQDILRSKFEELRAKNPSFSLRAFARKIKLSPSTLSEVLSGKRRLSIENVNKVAENLFLDPEERFAFLQSANPFMSRDSQYKKINAQKKEQRILSKKQFDVISEWMHFAILSLMKTKSFKSDHDYMAKRLGISKTRLIQSLQNLMDLGLITVGPSGEYKRTKESLSTSDNILDLSVQKAHLGDLEIIKEKIGLDVTKRDYTALTFPVDLALMNKAREIIRRAQDEIDLLMQKEGNCEEVYRMSCYFYPLTQEKELGKFL